MMWSTKSRLPKYTVILPFDELFLKTLHKYQRTTEKYRQKSISASLFLLFLFILMVECPTPEAAKITKTNLPIYLVACRLELASSRSGSGDGANDREEFVVNPLNKFVLVLSIVE